MTVMWASGFARVGDDDYYARDQPQERCPCHRGENEWRGKATEYVSGPSARSYVDERVFDELSIRVTWFDYDGYRDYKQLWGGFEPAVSILDLLFNVGAEAPDYLRYCRQ
ncbi:WbqC-like protein [Mycobacterium tuberculosis]|nr:WbqC-like protein [Mycobacterium tuberculosis]CKV86274.1 WbqC-like protein [Mycobacterium tuberculosis]